MPAGPGFAERGFGQELERVLASLREVAPAVIEHLRRDILAVQERLFWESSDRGINFDLVEPQRRVRVIEPFDRLAVRAA